MRWPRPSCDTDLLLLTDGFGRQAWVGIDVHPRCEETHMNGPLVTSIDMVRSVIADQIHALGGNDQVVDDVATAAAYAMWCLPTSLRH